MPEYQVFRTDTADLQIRQIILYISENFGSDTALKKLDELESAIMALSMNPFMGEVPRYPVLRHKRYRVLILEKDIVFYKVNESNKEVVIHAVFDQRQDYISILRGL